jgi:hypothetical protein
LKISDMNLVFGNYIELSAQNREDMRSGIEKRHFSYIGHIIETRLAKIEKAVLIEVKTKNI